MTTLLAALQALAALPKLFEQLIGVVSRLTETYETQKREQWIGAMLLILNIALLLFWISLLGAGFQKISDRLHQIVFAEMMIRSQPYFKWLTYSGVFIFLALLGVLTLAIRSMYTRKKVA